jgi:phosphatidylinositol 4-kinase
MLEAPIQSFVPSPHFRKIEPSPTEALTFNVAGALLSLGLNDTDLQVAVSDNIWAFLNTCTRAADSVLSPQAGDPDTLHLDDAIRTVTVAVALVGFLDAASAQADFWKARGRLELVRKVRHVLSDRFLVAVEGALSTIRHSQSQDREVKEWRRLVRHYAASDRPLGALLLQRSFMWLVVSTTSLMVADASILRNIHILDLLMSNGVKAHSDDLKTPDGDLHSMELYSALTTEQMNHVEAGADYVRLTPQQQKLAYAVKSAAMVSYLNCLVLSDEAADIDVLLNWLQESLEDTFQMADEGLASVVLRCMALICHLSPSLAPAVSRMLPRFLVQSSPQRDTVAVASKSLAFVLKFLSKDSIISTLYVLGNVISPETDATFVNGQANGDTELNTVYPGRQSMGSAISLRMNGEQETAVVYENVVQAICDVAAACNDEKITALAQSMLLQKLDKVSPTVDTHIVVGAASLALSSSQLEFRSLLKMYSRMCDVGVVDNKDDLLSAVSLTSLVGCNPLTDAGFTGPHPHLGQLAT